MKIRVMCAVPFRKLASGPHCVDGSGGQIYHNATPAFFVKDPSNFSISVAVSFLLEYEPDEKEVSHLEYIIGSASMDGTLIGTYQNAFLLDPFAPEKVKSRSRHLATYENLPLNIIKCSSKECGLIELSWALKFDTMNEPVEALERVYVRSWDHPNTENFLSSTSYNQWQFKQVSAR
jgi:hypothetical protein